MSDPYGSEEDQIRALKQWWADNGTSTIAGVVLAVAIVFGWKWWEAREAARAAQAATMYQQLQAAINAAATDEIQRATAEHLANELATEFDGSRHGDYGRLMLARLRVEANDLDAAATELRQVVSGTDDAAIKDLAKLRLARVLNALGKADEALKELQGISAFEVEVETLRGDILRSRNDRDGALAAYRKAAELNGMGDEPSGVLALKIEELETAPAGQALPPVASAVLAQEETSVVMDPAAMLAEPPAMAEEMETADAPQQEQEEDSEQQ